MNSKKPFLITGDFYVDDRGLITFSNEFNFHNIKRFYTIQNHNINFIRAWHGHKIEEKYFFVVDGTFLIGAVKIDNWEIPSKSLEIQKFVLSDIKPAILYVPEGYANGFMNLTQNNKLLIFSSLKVEDSLNDDFRFDAFYWDIWNIKAR